MNEVTVHDIPFDIAGFSEQGPRPENQDAFSIENFRDSSLLALADGMGGEKSGRLAADTALGTVLEHAPIRNIDGARRAVRMANDRIVEASESDPDQYGGMGCALALLSLARNRDGTGWIAAHVGDVRILSRSPDGVIRIETRDHTPAFARWEAGEILLDEIPDSAGANRLQRAVGRGGQADVAWLPIAPGWSWLVVSDGVYKAMRLDELAAAMGAPTADAVCEGIRDKVGERGADDNYTAVCVRALGPASAPPINRPTEKASAKREGVASLWRVTGVIVLLAIALAGLAFWSVRQANSLASQQAELRQIRAERDSLRALLAEPVDPFGPTIPPNTPGITTPRNGTTP